MTLAALQARDRLTYSEGNRSPAQDRARAADPLWHDAGRLGGTPQEL